MNCLETKLDPISRTNFRVAKLYYLNFIFSFLKAVLSTSVDKESLTVEMFCRRCYPELRIVELPAGAGDGFGVVRWPLLILAVVADVEDPAPKKWTL